MLTASLKHGEIHEELRCALAKDGQASEVLLFMTSTYLRSGIHEVMDARYAYSRWSYENHDIEHIREHGSGGHIAYYSITWLR